MKKNKTAGLSSSQQNAPTAEPRILIAIPCMSTVHTQFMQSMLDLRKTGNTSYAVYTSSMIYDSRNNFAANALKKGFDRVLWVDSDMVFEPDMLVRLSADIDEGHDLVAALAFKRQYPVEPVVYQSIEYDPANLKVVAEPYKVYPSDSVFAIRGCGFGCVMTTTELLRRIWEKYGPPFDPLTQMGEDLSFCYRAGLIDADMVCDSRVKVGHIGNVVFDERVYLAQPGVKELREGSKQNR